MARRAPEGDDRGSQVITSRNHPAIKRVRRLKRRSYRDADGLFVVEGASNLRDAVAAGGVPKELLFVTESAEDAGVLRESTAGKVPATEISEALLPLVSDVVTSQGIVGVFEQLDKPLERIGPSETGIAIVADEVRDPGNLGSILRVADAAGAGPVLVTKGSADLYNPKVVRSAAGSHFHLELIRGVEFDDCVKALHSEGFAVIGLDSRGETGYLDVDFVEPTAIVVGNEAFGMPPGHAEMLDGTARIEMPGRAESLNVAVSAGVVVFEALRQRRRREA